MVRRRIQRSARCRAQPGGPDYPDGERATCATLHAEALSPAQLDELQALLDAGPAAWGWADQCWTPARIAAVVHERLGVAYTLPGLDLLLHRLGWSVQVPARRAVERDEEQISAWREETWPQIPKGLLVG